MGDWFELTNHEWAFSIEATRQRAEIRMICA
jgi:glucokinase